VIISIASGKGGTGKTTIAVNLALTLTNAQLLDCDVEEPNAHLFIKPDIIAENKATILVPEIDQDKCTYCGKCREVCAYNAIAVCPQTDKTKGSVLVFPNLCHSCGACLLLCPNQAIREIEREIGSIQIGNKNNLDFISGTLNIGEAMSPPLIRKVKQHINKNKTVIIDAPPGTSCPVITAVKDSDYCVLVTEPTPFGLNDLILAVEVVRKLNIPFGVVINRADLGNDQVDHYCQKENIPILMKIPFSQQIAAAYSKGIPIIQFLPEYQQKFEMLWNQILYQIQREPLCQ